MEENNDNQVIKDMFLWAGIDGAGNKVVWRFLDSGITLP